MTRLFIESLEERWMLATYIVDQVGDSGAGTLRQAILDANSSMGADRIEFSIGGGGPQTLQPLSPLPEVTESVTIDGSTQPGYVGRPLIELRGDAAGNSSGFVIKGIASTLRALAINRFSSDSGEAQVILSGSGGHALEGNYIGVDLSGDASPISAHTMDYAIIVSSPSNRIGTNGDGFNDVAEGNVVTLPGSTGLILNQTNDADNLVIAGNHLGVNAAGTALLGFSYLGIWISGAGIEGIRIGTNADGVSDDLERNLISPNNSFASILIEAASGTVIAGNFIGTDISGTQSLGANGGSLILSAGATNTTIGTNADGVHDDAERNVISGLGGDGINLTGGAFTNTIAGNYIGVDVTGTQAIPNADDGIRLQDGASNNTIGGLSEPARNVIAGNNVNVRIVDANSSGNIVQGNYIGLNAAGTTPVTNGPLTGTNNDGIVIESGAHDNRIGGPDPGAGNVISGHHEQGIWIVGGGGNVIQANRLGTNAAGESAVANNRGVWIQNSPDNRVINNQVSGNYAGIVIEGSASTGQIIQGNKLGTNDAGDGAVPNTIGILLHGVPGAQIGGTAESERNVVSGNGQFGIQLLDGTSGTIIHGNYVGTTADGLSALGNGTSEFSFGIYLADAPSNTVGGGVQGAGNLISGNAPHGVGIFGTGSTGNRVQGNFIGLDRTGNRGLGNLGWGLNIVNGASGNIIGTDGDGNNDASEGNVISGHQLRSDAGGVYLGSTSNDNVVAGNLVGTGASGTTTIPNFKGILVLGNRNRIGTNSDGTSDTEEGNVVSGNEGIGIDIQTGSENRVAGNYIGTNVAGSDYRAGRVGWWKGEGDFSDSADNHAGTPHGGVSFTAGQVGQALQFDGSSGYVDLGSNSTLDNPGSTTLSVWVNVSDLNITIPFLIADFDVTGFISQGSLAIFEGHFFWYQVSDTESTRLSSSTSVNLDEWYHVAVVRDDSTNQLRMYVNGQLEAESDFLGTVVPLQRNKMLGRSGPEFGDYFHGALDEVRIWDRPLTSAEVLAIAAAGGQGVKDTMGNVGGGVRITDGGHNNTLGGSALGAGNVIAGSQINVLIQGAASTANLVQGNTIGADVTGTVLLNQAQAFSAGVRVADAPGNVIGGSGAGNLVVGGYNNIQVQGAAAVDNVIQGNYVGVNRDGSGAIISNFRASGPSERGILVSDGASQTIIGGVSLGEGNLVSGHFGVGIDIYGPGENLVAGNRVGTNAAGDLEIGNFRGVVLNNTPDNRIMTNLLSGNYDGILVSGSGSTDTIIQGNLIGTTAAGTDLIGNLWYGINLVGGATGTLIGGTTEADRNIVSGNLADGIRLEGSNHRIQGNYIGTDVTGTRNFGNANSGIYTADATDVWIGGGNAGEGNLISGNVVGVFVLGANLESEIRQSNVHIQGNRIGTTADGMAALPNYYGVRIAASGGNFVGTDGDGTNDANERNLIAGNSIAQVDIVSDRTEGNLVAGNWIGLDATGLASIEGGGGVSVINGAGRNRIGTDANGISDEHERNVIAAPTGTAVFMENTFENVVAGNWIGTNALGTGAIGSLYGITISQSSNNRIGGTSEVQRNVIGGITNYSVQIAASTGNEVLGNYIGTDISGTATLGTGLVGVIVTASGNVIGGSAPGAGNVIGGQATGVILDGVSTTANIVQGNFIGVGADGTTRLENQDGITLRVATGNVIGGAGLGQGNVISGSSAFGVLLLSTSGNTLQGNRIGTDAVGAAAVYNTYGIGLVNDWYSVVGGAEPGAGNLISGNLIGVTLYGGLASRYTRIQGNRIGTTADGLAALGNAFFGVDVAGLDGNRVQDLIIGGTELGEGNVIAATNGPGIRVRGTGSERVTIQGNFIGLGLDGDSPLGNAGAGIHIENSAGHLIGGGVAGARNVISTNLNAGISLSGAGTIGNRIQGNYVGIDATGLVERGNRQYGIALDAGASFNFIGTDGDGVQDALEGNVISGHTYQSQDAGIYLGNGHENVVAGNWIGTDVTGTRAIPNDDGIEVFGDHMQIGTDGDGISDDLERNVISGNLTIGISIYGPAATDTAIRGNFIGTDYTGTQELGNLLHGISVVFSSRVQIGGLSLAERNIISSNQGVGISAELASDLQIQGNYIGTDVTGTLERGNQYGIRLYSTPDVVIGGGLPGAGNLISGNDQGIWLQFPDTTNVRIQGNRIGTNAAGTAAIANTGHGIFASASSNFIGVDGDGVNDDGEGNLISGNLDTAIFILGNSNVIAGNLIGTDSNGTEVIGNGRAVRVLLGSSNRIGTNADGTSDVLERNIISGNSGIGVSILAEPGRPEGANHNVVAGNYIGTDITGTRMLGNASQGVSIGLTHQGDVLAPPTGNTIGGRTPVERNLIAGSGGYGMYLERAEETLVLGNYIGTDVTGTIAFPNATGAPGGPPAGILLWRSARNQIGDGTPGGGNLISGNIGYGLQIWAAGSDDNRVQGNFIGTNAAGTAALGNTGGGISSGFGAIRTTIGTDGDGTFDATEGNLVSGDPTWVGIGVGGVGDVVAGNKIGTDHTGTFAVPNAYGLFVSGSGIRVGTNADGVSDDWERNIISGNLYTGVGFNYNYGSSGNIFAGNHVGLNVDGDPLGNGGGIEFHNSNQNLIGSNADGVRDDVERNVIAANRSFGIAIHGSGDYQSTGNIIAGNYIGTGIDGVSDRGNATHGIDLYSGSQGTTVGGTTEAARNVISGNGLDGIRIADSSDHQVLGNYIGVDRSGATALPNEQGGIQIFSYYYTGADGQPTSGNTIGGAAPGEGNLISGNDGYGVTIIGDFATGNFVQGNRIGTDSAGRLALGNTGSGVSIDNASHNTVGGNDLSDGLSDGIVGARNIISGNPIGVEISGAAAAHNQVAGNFVGLNVTGTLAIGLGYAGQGVVVTAGASNNTIGGTEPGSRNVISGHANGIYFDETATTDNIVVGNYIGTTADGLARLGNYDGITLRLATGNRVGGPLEAQRNLISGNARFGVQLGGTGGNVVQGNYIGTDPTGQRSNGLGNAFGIGVVQDSNSLIGGTESGAGNVISSNQIGIKLYGYLTSNARIEGNLIGTTADGQLALGNAFYGIEVHGDGNRVHDLTIGGTQPGAGNVISGNGERGIWVHGPDAERLKIQGNYIGTNITGTSGIANVGGIYLENAAGVMVGGTELGAENLISGNTQYGVAIAGATATNNTVTGNLIGTDASGNLPIGNLWGVWLKSGTHDNRIGGPEPDAGNVISGNLSTGVYFEDLETTNNLVAGNLIGLNAAGTARVGNVDGIAIASASGNQIGGPAPGERNVISGNTRFAVHLSSLAGNTIQGNFVGTDVNGSTAHNVGNFHNFYLNGDANSLIGGTEPGEGNVIANGIMGIWLDGTPSNRFTTGTRIQGNRIGTDATGAHAFGNGYGIYVDGRDIHEVHDITIGGASAGAGNLIAGNSRGVSIVGQGAKDIRVQGNLIGTDASGLDILKNQENVWIENAAGVLVGGTTPGARNVIAGGNTNITLKGAAATGAIIQGNYIGLDVTGDQALPGDGSPYTNYFAIYVYEDSGGHQIGGLEPGAGNVIGGHVSAAVVINGSGGNLIAGNRIGTNAAGDAAVGNAGGISVGAAPNNTIARNLISGNYRGIALYGTGASNQRIVGNFIGTNALGDAPIPNSYGIYVENAPAVTIGGTAEGDGNLISGNSRGIDLNGAHGTVVQGNLIGTNLAGTEAIPGAGYGIYAFDTADMRIGGSVTGARNVISGQINAVIIEGPASQNNRFQGNYVGTNAAGTAVLSNQAGVSIGGGAAFNTVGTDGDGVGDAGEGNLISGNPLWGVSLGGNANDNVVAGNLVGTDHTGTIVLPSSGGVGVSYSGSRNRIGTNADGISDELERNIVVGGVGLFLDPLVPSVMADNVIKGNYIGTDVTGTIAFGVAQSGIRLGFSRAADSQETEGPVRTIIGGTTEVERNIIAGFSQFGILGDRAVGTVIQGNYIGTDVTGTQDRGNGTGIQLYNSPGTVIGGGQPGAGNLISGNEYGITIGYPQTIHSRIQGNKIGTDVTGTRGLANTYTGIGIYNGGSDNFIGVDGDGLNDAGEGNLVSGNPYQAIAIQGDRNVVAGNLIGTDQRGEEIIGNGHAVTIGLGSYNRVGTNADGVSDELERNVISGNTGAGVAISASPDRLERTDHNVVAGNYIGTDITGTRMLGNGWHGVVLSFTHYGDFLAPPTRNTIGGTTPVERNIIAGNNNYGVAMFFSNETIVQGNYIGTDVTGSRAFPNAAGQLAETAGVVVYQGNHNQIGGGEQGAGNVISGNNGYGVAILYGGADNNRVQGNLIGTDARGAFAVPNTQGVWTGPGTVGNIIGVDGDGVHDENEGNVISGHVSSESAYTVGVTLQGSHDVLAGNKIGTDITGTLAIPNSFGVGAYAFDSLIGTNADGVSDELERNLIAGNLNFGLNLNYGASGNVVAGNWIGLDASGQALGNGGGINLAYGAQGVPRNNLIGTNADNMHDAAERNVISGNVDFGIRVTGWADAASSSSNNVVAGNFIGTDPSGTRARPNRLVSNVNMGDGIQVWNGATGITIGGTHPAARNVISGNEGSGIDIDQSSDIVILGNFIGTDHTGTVALANQADGISVASRSSSGPSTGTIIGGVHPGAGNVISGNHANGITLLGSRTNFTQIAGNLIGVDVTGNVSLSNQIGVRIEQGASNNLIGGTLGGASNVISGNRDAGVHIVGADVANNVVQRNFIGTDRTARRGLANQQGIIVQQSASTTIGGELPELGNTIAYNSSAGIWLVDSPAASAETRNNRVFYNAGLGIDLGALGPTLNDPGDVDGLLNFPVITSAVIDEFNLTISGFARPGALIDFYRSVPTLNGMGQGDVLLASFGEGSEQDSDLEAGSYGPDVRGLPVGSDSTNRFRFLIPRSLLPNDINFGSLLTAVAIGSTSESGNAIPIGDVQTGMAPVVDVGPDQSVNQGQWLVINGAFTDDDSTSWSATVDYGDGTVEPLALRADRSFSLQHQYALAGQYVVTAWVVDNSQMVGSDQLQVTVVNEAPTATFNFFTITSPAMEGSTITLRGEFTDPGLNDIHQLEIDWGDNTPTQMQILPPGEREFEVTHVYVDDAPTGTPRDVYRVQVTIVDNYGGRDSTPLGLFLEDVINVAPNHLIVTPSAPLIDENSYGFSLSGSFFDPGVLDTHQVTIDWGDGSPKETIDLALADRNFSDIVHVYRDNPDNLDSQYLIRVEVADDDEPLRPAVATVPVTVRNVLPHSVVVSASATTIKENDAILLSGSFLDPGSLDTHRVEIDWGDGSTEVISLRAGENSFSSIPHQYRDNAVGGDAYTIGVRVFDDDQPNVSVAVTTVVTVNNLPPTLTGITSDILGVLREGDWVTVSGSYADTGSRDRHVVEIFWSDGTSSFASIDSTTNSFVATHQLIDDNPTGTPLDATHIRIVITDDDGDTAEQLLPINIANVPPAVDIRPGANSTQALVELIADVQDPGVADSFTFHWEITVAGTTVSTLGGPTYVLDRTGNFNDVFVVRLTVSDDDTGSTTLTTALKVGTPLSDNIVVTDSDFSALGVNDMIVLGLESTDVINATAVSAGNRVRLDGGTGNDRLFGGAGDDIFFLRGGDDSANLASIVGDPVPVYAGADRYFLVPNSTQRVADYEGSNAVDFSLADFGVTFDLSARGVLQDVDPTGDAATHFVWVEGSFAELAGSAFNDTLTADANAALWAGDGADLLQIESDAITNVFLAGGDGDDRFLLSGSNLSNIRAGGDDGADLMIVEGTLDDLVFTGGADDDEVRLMTAAVVSSFEFRGDDGADLMIVEGTLDDLVFTGGADDDELRVISRGQSIRFQGDDGADLMIVEGTLDDLVFTGGADDDHLHLIVSSAVSSIQFRGDDGADLMIVEGTLDDLVFTGGADDDLLRIHNTVFSRSVSFQGDDGADLMIIEGTLDDLVFTGGADNDELQLLGSSAIQTIAFRGDDGADLMIVEGTLDDLVFTGGADDDQLQLLGSSAIQTIAFRGDDGADLMIIEGTLDDLVFTGGADDDLLRTTAMSHVQKVRYRGDDGADLMIVEGTLDDLVFTGGADDDYLRTLPSSSLRSIHFRGDDGADLMIVEGSLDDLVFTGGADNDRLRITTTSTAHTAVFQGDDGADLMIVEGVLDDLVFTGGADNDRLLISISSRSQVIAFNGDDGADLMIVEGTLDDLVFTGGADDDQLLIEPSARISRVQYFGDDGADLMIVEGSLDDVVFTGGADQDRLITLTGGQGAIDFYGVSASAVGDPNGSRDILYNLGHGWTSIRMHAAANGSVLQNRGNQIGVLTLLGGQGADALVNYGSQISQIVMLAGDGSDLLINDAANVASILVEADGYSGEKTLINYGNYTGEHAASITFRGGHQIDAFQNNGEGYTVLSIYGGAGGDTFQNNAAGITELFFDGGEGSDVLENNGAGVQRILFEGGQGDDIFANDGGNVTQMTFWSGNGKGTLINTGSEIRQLTYYGSAGQDTLVNQGQHAANIVMFGGAGDDRLINIASGASQLTMFGDEGDDAFYNLATATDTEHITFTGGPGNNRLINQASQVDGLTFTADNGDDLFQSSGTAITNIQVSWGDGANTLRLDGSDISQISLLGGQDNDIVVIDADALHTMEFIGNGGNDLLLVNGDHAANILFHGGLGHDSLAVNGRWASNISFHGEDGQDRLQILGTQLQSLSFFGGADDDAAQLSGAGAVQFFMSGDDGNDLLFLLSDDLQAAEFVGGPGLDTLISSGNRSGTVRFDGGPDADTLRTAGLDLQELVFLGGSGSDGLVMNHLSGTASVVRFDGSLGDEMVAIRGRADRIELDLGEGNDLVLHSGDGHVTVSGGSGDDHLVLTGTPTGSIYIDEFFTGSSDDSRDLIDLSGLSQPTSSNEVGIRLDLMDTAIQQLTDEFILKLSDSNGIEDVIGTLGADTILGNDRDNNIQGAQYQPMLPPTGTVASRSRTQWVLLDFDTYTQSELDEYSYSAEDRQAIAERIGAAFQDVDENSPWLDVRIALDHDQIPPETTFTTIFFNQTPSFGRPGGEASEIDFLNRNLSGFAVVQVNGLLGGLESAVPANEDFVQQLPEDADLAAVGSRKPPATRENVLALSTKIATHELGHLLGLMHADAFGPIGFGIHAPPGALEFTPEIFGPAVAFETFEHLIGSPGSIGSTRFNDIGQLFFGERESIKLALAAAQLSSLVTSESTVNHGSRETAQPLQLMSLPVPSLSRVGINAGKTWDVRAAVVAGTIELQNQISESDIYAIEGFAGQVLSIEIFSQTLEHLQGNTIDPVVRLFDEAGQLVAYFDGVAVNDDQFEGSESRLIDVRLPSDGVYYVEVDTFRRASDDPLCQDLDAQQGELYDRLLAACNDQDTGGYELLIYSFATYNPADGIDTLLGRGGVDVLNGGPNDDYAVRVQLPTEVLADEGSTLNLVGVIEDRGGQSWSGRVNYGDGTGWQELLVDPSGSFSLFHSYPDNGTYYLTVEVNNDDQLEGLSTTMVDVANLAPVLGGIIAPVQPVLVSTLISTELNFSDAGLYDSHEVQWDWGDGAVSAGTVTGVGGSYLALGSHSYALPGIYRVKAVVTDDDGAVSQQYYDYIVVVGQSGSVTGAANLEIPNVGAATPTLVHISNSIHSTSNGLSGNFRLRLLQQQTLFDSTQLNWLVVNGSTATYAGRGLLDGVSGYSFLVSVFDGRQTGQPDRVRVKIWKELTGEIWLDTQIGAPDFAPPMLEIRNGNILVRE